MKLSIGSDHGGYELKTAIIEYLKQQGYEVVDHGTKSTDSVDYPDYAATTGEAVAKGSSELGILICTSGIGISIAANKIKGVRAGIAFNEDMAEYMRLHNDANIICFGQKYITPYMANKLIDIFIKTKFEGGRHQRRVDKISTLED